MLLNLESQIGYDQRILTYFAMPGITVMLILFDWFRCSISKISNCLTCLVKQEVGHTEVGLSEVNML